MAAAGSPQVSLCSLQAFVPEMLSIPVTMTRVLFNVISCSFLYLRCVMSVVKCRVFTPAAVICYVICMDVDQVSCSWEVNLLCQHKVRQNSM